MINRIISVIFLTVWTGLDNSENITWPYKMSADVEGLITLGGLHMVHERNEAKTCGPIMAQGGVQAMETMLYTIDHINKQSWWIKDVPLGNKIEFCQFFKLSLW